VSYVQGFLIPVPNGNREAYRAMAAKTAPFFKEYGALRIVECWGEAIPHGTVTDFYKAVQAEEGENVVFAWVVWPDKQTCDAAHDKMMADGRMETPPADMPFDGKRMIFGGFSVLLDEGEG
jgi:uncharacterized protein YbaA (DUF1428 family)